MFRFYVGLTDSVANQTATILAFLNQKGFLPYRHSRRRRGYFRVGSVGSLMADFVMFLLEKNIVY